MLNAKTFRTWMQENYEVTTLEDICNHGCISGFPGLIYYSETSRLYAKFKDEIWGLLHSQAEDYGYDNILAMLAENRNIDVSEPYLFANYLVWSAAELIAYQLTQNEDE